ncbi:MAG: 50S ribosomal protein L19 [Brevinema sp.]
MSEENVKTAIDETSTSTPVQESHEQKSVKNNEPTAKIVNTLHDIELMLLEEQNNNDKFPKFGVGDTIRISVRIKEGNKERIQAYEGVVLCFKHGMNRKTFMVRRVTAGISIERVFSFHSPYLASIEIIRRAKVRRSKLYFLRGRFGKAARLKELALKKGENKKINH